MAAKPRIFISAVSREFMQSRQLIAQVLERLGYEPVRQDIFGTEPGDLCDMLRDKIDSCQGLIHIVGAGYGAEPTVPDPQLGRVSYTQFELLYARAQGKKTWVLFANDDCSRDTPLHLLDLPFEPNHPEPEKHQAERRALQAAWRESLKQDGHLRYEVSNDTELELRVERLRDEYAELRQANLWWQRRVTWTLTAVAALVVLLVIVSIAMLKSQDETGEIVRQTGETAEKTSATVEKTGELVQKTNETVQKTGETLERTSEAVEKTRETAERTNETVTRTNETIDLEAFAARVDRAASAMDLGDYGHVEALEKLTSAGRRYTKLKGIALAGADLAGSNFSNAEMRGSDLSTANFSQSNLAKADLTFAALANTQFAKADLSQATVLYATAEEANFQDAILEEASCFGSKFRGANFRGADLSGADLSMCDLRDADFSGADLTECFLVGSVLDGAVFTNATFQNTDVTGAALSRAQLSDAQFAQVGRTSTDALWFFELMEKTPSSRYDSGYSYEEAVKLHETFPSFHNRSLPICKPRTVAPSKKRVYEAGGTESISTYSKVFLEHEFIEIGDRRREFVNSVKDHVDFLKANLQANRALDGGGSQTASWSDTLTANAQQLEAGPRLFATNDHMAVLLLGADVLDRGKIRWDNLAMDKYRTERLGPNDSATDMPARDAWPAFYPAEIPSDELPDNHQQFYQQWTERRAKVAPRDRLTLLGTLPASRIEYALGSGELEATLDEVNWRWTLSWPSAVQTAIDERGINRDNVWVAPIRNHMFGITAAVFVFSLPKESYQFHADGLTSGRPFIDVEIDLEIGEIEQQRDEYSHVILIHAKPVRVEVLNKGESLWQGSVTEVSEGN